MPKILTILIFAIISVPVWGTAAGSFSVPEDIPGIYRQSLPQLNGNIGDSPENKACHIIDYIHSIGGGVPLNAETRADHITRLAEKIRNTTPIQLVMLGFSCKSDNTQKKVLSEDFEMADYLGLVRLEHLAQQIESFSGTECRINIINKEPYIPEIFQVAHEVIDTVILSPQVLRNYQNTLETLIGTCPHLQLGLDLTEAYNQRKQNVEYHTEAARTKISEAAHGSKAFFSCELDYEKINDILRSRLQQQNKKSGSNFVATERLETIALPMALAYQLGVTIFRDVVREHPDYQNMFRLSVHGDDTKMMMNFGHTPGHETLDTITCTAWHASLLCDFSRQPREFSLKRLNQKPTDAIITSQIVNGFSLAFMFKG